jgi:hypothetical protein
MSEIKINLCLFNLIVSICLISTISLAQVNDSIRISDGDHGNSLAPAAKSKTVYASIPHFNLIPMQLSLSKAKYPKNFSYMDFMYENQFTLDNNNFYSFNQIIQKRLQNDLRNNLKWLQKDQRKYDLGWVSQALGYTNVAAALGLAAYHIYKYEIKKEKDD